MEQNQGQGVRMSDIAKSAGVSRQAVYLHFESRVDLMNATTKYVDEVLGLDERLQCVSDAPSATKALELFIEVWGNYIPEIYGLSKALLAVRDTDEAASKAWDECMSCLRNASRDIVEGLNQSKVLSSQWTNDAAGDLLWTMLSVQNWEQLINDCGWSQTQYVDGMTKMIQASILD